MPDALVYFFSATAVLSLVTACPAGVSMLSAPKRLSYSLTTPSSSMLRRLAAYGLMTMRSVSWIVFLATTNLVATAMWRC